MQLNMINHLLWHITACFTSIFYDGCGKGYTFCQKLHLLLPPKKGDKWRLRRDQNLVFFLQLCRPELPRNVHRRYWRTKMFSVSVGLANLVPSKGGGFFSGSAMYFSHCQNKYSKLLSWTWNLNKLFTVMGRHSNFKFRIVI